MLGSSPPALWSQAQTFGVPDIFYLYDGVEALLRGGDERSVREGIHRFAERAEVNERERVAYLRSLAVLSEFEGDQERAIAHLYEARKTGPLMPSLYQSIPGLLLPQYPLLPFEMACFCVFELPSA